MCEGRSGFVFSVLRSASLRAEGKVVRESVAICLIRVRAQGHEAPVSHSDPPKESYGPLGETSKKCLIKE